MARKFYKEENEAIPAIQFVKSKPQGYTEITDEDEIKSLYKIQYSYRIEAGKEYVKNFTTDRYIDTLNGTYTDGQVFELEAYLKDLYSQLNNKLNTF